MWEEALREILCGLAKKDGAETQAAADRLFKDAEAFDGTVAGGREFSAREGLAELFDQGIVAAFDAAKRVLLRVFHGG